MCMALVREQFLRLNVMSEYIKRGQRLLLIFSLVALLH